MLCFIVKKRITGSFGSRGAQSKRVEKHIRQCARCKEFLQRHTRIHEALSSIERLEGELPPFIHRRIMNALESERQPVGARKGLNITTAGAVCAMLVVGLGLFLYQSPQNTDSVLLSDVKRESFQSLETGVEQLEQLVSDAPDVLIRPLAEEVQLLREDLLTVAEKLDSCLNGAVFTMIAPENG